MVSDLNRLWLLACSIPMFISAMAFADSDDYRASLPIPAMSILDHARDARTNNAVGGDCIDIISYYEELDKYLLTQSGAVTENDLNVLKSFSSVVYQEYVLYTEHHWRLRDFKRLYAYCLDVLFNEKINSYSDLEHASHEAGHLMLYADPRAPLKPKSASIIASFGKTPNEYNYGRVKVDTVDIRPPDYDWWMEMYLAGSLISHLYQNKPFNEFQWSLLPSDDYSETYSSDNKKWNEIAEATLACTEHPMECNIMKSQLLESQIKALSNRYDKVLVERLTIKLLHDRYIDACEIEVLLHKPE